jgi:hypothetical protein
MDLLQGSRQGVPVCIEVVGFVRVETLMYSGSVATLIVSSIVRAIAASVGLVLYQ